MTKFDRGTPTLRELDALLREDFYSFIGKSFITLNPGARYLANFHIRSLAWHLEQIRLGRIKRLIITLPPRSLKSHSASVAFPAFVHGKDPTKHIVCVSYGQDLASKLQNDYRQLLRSPFYRRLFPATRIASSKDSESEVMLTGRGTRFATSISGTLTGRGADIVVIDDPHKASDAYSEIRRTFVNDWFSQSLLTRLNDQGAGAIVIVMQRVHAFDLVGNRLERAEDLWTVLNLPAISFKDEYIRIGDDEYHFRKADTVLHPERTSGEDLEKLRRELGSEVFQAQYLQTPVPPGGLLFRREWFQRYDSAPNDGKGEVIQSWDTASKIGGSNDYSVCTTWFIGYGNYYLLDVTRGKWEFPALKAKAIEIARIYRPNRVLVEEAGIGVGLIHELKTERINAIGVKSTQSKKERAAIQTAKFEAKRVFFPRQAPWLSDLEAELLEFDGGRHDDQVDSLVQALGYEIKRIIFRKYNLYTGKLIYSSEDNS